MIKLGDERQEEVLRELGGFHEEVGAYLELSRQELRLLRDELRGFSAIVAGFMKSLEGFAASLHGKVARVVEGLSRPGSAAYAPFTLAGLRHFRGQFDRLRLELERLLPNGCESALRSFSEFEQILLAELSERTESFRAQLAAVEEERQRFRRKRNDFLGELCTLETEQLQRLSAGGTALPPDWLLREKAQLGLHVQMNRSYGSLLSTYEALSDNYRLSAQQKLVLYRFKACLRPDDIQVADGCPAKPGRPSVAREIYLGNSSALLEHYQPLEELALQRLRRLSVGAAGLLRQLEAQPRLKRRAGEEACRRVTHVLLWDLGLPPGLAAELVLSYELEASHVHRVLLCLKLLLKVERRVLLLSPGALELLELLLGVFLQRLVGKRPLPNSTLETLGLMLHVAARTAGRVDGRCLLGRLGGLQLLSDYRFWTELFTARLQALEQREKSLKLRGQLVARKLAYYHFLVHRDIEMSSSAIDGICSDFGLNYRVGERETLSKAAFWECQLHSEPPKEAPDRRSRLQKALLLTVSAGLLERNEVLALGWVRPGLFRPLKRAWVRWALRQSPGREQRRRLWRLLADRPPAPGDQQLNEQTRELIHIDVLRTRQARGEDNQATLERVILRFLVQSPRPREYFQGFNFIVAFLLEQLGKEEHVLALLAHVSAELIEDFFNDKLCHRLETLHHQVHRLLARHFPALWTHWKALELRSELVFANFLICLFTSFGFESADFVCEFWDELLLVGLEERLERHVQGTDVRA